MALNAMGMGFMFTARDLATGTINKVKRGLTGLSGTSKETAATYELAMAKMRKGALALGVAVVGIGAMVKVAGTFGKFQYTMAAVGQVTGATAEEMKRLSAAAIQAGIDTQFSPREAAQGLQALGAAGMNASEAMKVLHPVLDLAAGSLGQLGVAGAAENVVGVLNAFSMQASRAAEVTDKLVTITQKSNFQARDFQIAISQAASSASSANQTFESMLATLGMMRNANLHASVAATAYRNAMLKLSSDKKAWKEMSRLGVHVMDAEGKKIRDLAAIMGDLAPKIEKLGGKEKGLAIRRIFGMRGMKVYSAFVAQYNKLLKEGKVVTGDYAGAHRLLMVALRNSAGAAAKNRDALLQTAEGQRILLKGSWETTQIMMGKLAVPMVLPALKALTGVLNVFIKLINMIPAPARQVMSTLLGVSLALKAMKGAFLLFRGLGAIAMMRNLASAAGGVGGAAGAATRKVGLMGRMTARYGRTYMNQVRGFMGMLGGLAGAAIPIVFAVFSYMAQKEEEEKRRQKEVRQAALRARAAYYSAVMMAKELRRQTAKALAEEVRAGAKTADKAEQVYRRMLKQTDAQRLLVKSRYAEFNRLRTTLGANNKQTIKAHAEWQKSSAKFDAMYRAQQDAEANLAKFRIRTAKTVAEKQLYGRQIVLQRTYKYEKMMADYHSWGEARQRAIDRIQNKRERAAAQRTFDRKRKTEKESIFQFKRQTARMAYGWKLADKDILVRHGQARKLSHIVQGLRSRGAAPTASLINAGQMAPDWTRAAVEGRLPRGKMTQDQLQQYMQYQQFYRSGRGWGKAEGLQEQYLLARRGYAGLGAGATMKPGGQLVTTDERWAESQARREASRRSGLGAQWGVSGGNEVQVASLLGGIASALGSVAGGERVTNVNLDGRRIATVVTEYQAAESTNNDGTGAVTATTGVQGGG